MYFMEMSTNIQNRINRANKILKKQYGFKIDESTPLRELQKIKLSIKQSMNDLLLKESSVHKNPLYARNILMLEAINLLIENNTRANNKLSHVLGGIVELSGFLVESGQKVTIDELASLVESDEFTAKDISSILEQFYASVLLEYDDDEDRDSWSPYGNKASDEDRKAAAALLKTKYGQKDKTDVKTPSAQQTQIAIAQDLLKKKKSLGSKFKKFMTKKFKEGIIAAKQPSNILETKQNYVSKIRVMLESELEQAEVLIAVKGFAKELQNMMKKLGRLQNEDLGPVVDQMREVYGNEMADDLGGSLNELLQGILDDLNTGQIKISKAVNSIALGKDVPSMNDMDLDMDVDINSDDDPIDNVGEFDMEDPVSGAEGEPLGRIKKESVNVKKQELNR